MRFLDKVSPGSSEEKESCYLTRGDARDLLVQVADEKNERVPVFSGHSSEITALAVNGDGSLLASGDSSGKYIIWEICSRQCLKLSSMRGSISSLQFVANWPSTHAAEHNSAHPNFELQRILTKGEKIPIIPHAGSDHNKVRFEPSFLFISDWSFTVSSLIQFLFCSR
ncbi:WD domain, G-beta repeat protein [Teladorsagia circumcincta]|uniref:WD domain, G-beta repeat protein n=1 Tax=Teladorsagia circumcincta TaxID=45464 RepID=A0A2G9TND4_TELCI|nr:WD domain, G-beta repeat protein [Teladorsagia circumcincta]